MKLDLKSLNWIPGTAGWYPDQILPPPVGAPGFTAPSMAQTLLERRSVSPQIPAAALAQALQSPTTGPQGRGRPTGQSPVMAAPPMPRPRPAAMDTAPQVYRIRKGDNLTKIAKRFGTTIEALVKANNIKNPDRIYAGADLIIPKG